jgi:hypothetical protein
MYTHIQKQYILPLLVAGLLFQLQPVMAVEWVNLVIAQDEKNNGCTDMKDTKCDGKRVPPVSKPSITSILQLTAL